MALNKVFHVKNEAALADMAQTLAPHLQKGMIMALEGDVGAGKTAFARALIRHLTGNPALDVPSPTFTLVQTYETPLADIWHFDLYRLKHESEIYELGWEDALANKALMLIEWPSRIENILPASTITITIKPEPDGTRTIEVAT